MIVDIGSGWALEIEYGPNWLFVRPRGPASCEVQDIDLAEQVERLLEQHLTRRVVLELDEVGLLRSELIGQLVHLHARVQSQGGLMRLAGVSDDNYALLRDGKLSDRFPQYADRHEAVMGHRPNKPR